jgi:hypothetical protein
VLVTRKWVREVKSEKEDQTVGFIAQPYGLQQRPADGSERDVSRHVGANAGPQNRHLTNCKEKRRRFGYEQPNLAQTSFKTQIEANSC